MDIHNHHNVDSTMDRERGSANEPIAMVAESTVNSMIQTFNIANVMQLPVDLTKKLQLGSFSRHVADRKLQKNEETINSFSLASLIALFYL